ncbi:hypothetical protein DZ915_028370, partial [Pseudomonas aeruginosa]|nr:hypothetical protein [Pseudomonas aeruginosa]
MSRCSHSGAVPAPQGDPAMFSKHDQIRGYDDELLAAMDAEERRQE